MGKGCKWEWAVSGKGLLVGMGCKWEWGAGLPPVCSVMIAIIRSIDPKTARWIITCARRC